MVSLLLAALQPLISPTERGLFETAGLYLVRVTTVEVPDRPKLYGPTLLRIDDVLIGPQALKGTSAVYKFFAPRGTVVGYRGGFRYSGVFPDFAYPAQKGHARYWWAAPGPKGDGWVTADFHKLARFLPPPGPELLLQADLEPDSKRATEQDELVKALVKLESKRTRIEQIAVLREMQRSDTLVVYSTANRIMKVLTDPPKDKK